MKLMLIAPEETMPWVHCELGRRWVRSHYMYEYTIVYMDKHVLYMYVRMSVISII